MKTFEEAVATFVGYLDRPEELKALREHAAKYSDLHREIVLNPKTLSAVVAGVLQRFPKLDEWIRENAGESASVETHYHYDMAQDVKAALCFAFADAVMIGIEMEKQ